MNKRIKGLSIFCAVAMSMSLFAGCGNSSTKEKNNKSEVNSKSEIVSNSENDDYKGVFENLNEDTNSDKIMSTIEELASEKYNGRLTGTEGNKMATEYIENKFKELSLETLEGIDGYLQYYTQKVPYLKNLPKMNIIDKSGDTVKEFKFLKDFFMLPEPFLIKMKSEVRFKGNVSGEIVYIKDKEEFNKNKDNLANKILLTTEEVAFNCEMPSNLLGVILAGEKDQDFKKPVGLSGKSEYRNNEEGPVIAICDLPASEVLKVEAKKGNSLEISIDYSIEDKKVANVIGVIPGTDEKLKDDYIIISGHFDHLGSNHDGTYNPGASDNASGTAAMLEIARIMKLNDIKPKRPIIFAAFNGEENGLQGSKNFVLNTALDIKKVKMLNIDMIAHKLDNPLTFCAINESELLEDLCEIADEMKIAYKKMLETPLSDHTPIEKKGGQAVTFIEVEQPEYHTPKDTIEIIKKTDLEQIVELVLRYISNSAF